MQEVKGAQPDKGVPVKFASTSRIGMLTFIWSVQPVLSFVTKSVAVKFPVAV